jgi:hypothetical protein
VHTAPLTHNPPHLTAQLYPNAEHPQVTPAPLLGTSAVPARRPPATLPTPISLSATWLDRDSHDGSIIAVGLEADVLNEELSSGATGQIEHAVQE